MKQPEIYYKVLNSVAKDNLKNAIELLMDHFNNNQILIQSARLQALQTEINNGTISFENAGIEKNKIRKAIISLAEEIRIEYPIEIKRKISKKLNYFAILLSKKRKSKALLLLSFLILTSGDLLQKVIVAATSFTLTIAGVSFIIIYETTISKNAIKQEKVLFEQRLNYIDDVCESKFDTLQNKVIRFRNDLIRVRDNAFTYSGIPINEIEALDSVLLMIELEQDN